MKFSCSFWAWRRREERSGVQENPRGVQKSGKKHFCYLAGLWQIVNSSYFPLKFLMLDTMHVHCICKWRAGENKCLVSIYVFPEMKLLFPNRIIMSLSPSSYTQISVRDLYISRIGLPILLQGIYGPIWEYINRSHTHECGNWDCGRAIPRKEIHKLDFPCSVYNYMDDLVHRS